MNYSPINYDNMEGTVGLVVKARTIIQALTRTGSRVWGLISRAWLTLDVTHVPDHSCSFWYVYMNLFSMLLGYGAL